MIYTKRFKINDSSPAVSKITVMDQLNDFIKEKKIKRSNILEFRTDENINDMYFEVVMSWWQNN